MSGVFHGYGNFFGTFIFEQSRSTTDSTLYCDSLSIISPPRLSNMLLYDSQDFLVVHLRDIIRLELVARIIIISAFVYEEVPEPKPL